MLKGYKKEWGDKPSTLHQGKTRGEYLKEQHKSTPRSKALGFTSKEKKERGENEKLHQADKHRDRK